MYWELEITEIEGERGCVWELDDDRGSFSPVHEPVHGRLQVLNGICIRHGRRLVTSMAIPSNVKVYTGYKFSVRVWTTYIYILAPDE